MDERTRVAVDRLAYALLRDCWHLHAADLGAPPSADGDDRRLDRAAAVLLGDRDAALMLRLEVELQEAAWRLRSRARIEAEHARDFAPIDPIDALALDPDPAVAAAAMALRAADAQAQGHFAEPGEYTPATVAKVRPYAFAALASVIRDDADPAGRLQLDRAADRTPDAGAHEPYPADRLVSALATGGRLQVAMAIDGLASGHVGLWIAAAARLLEWPPERMALTLLHPGETVPSLARLLAPDRETGARILLLLARAASPNEDRAGMLVERWLEAFNALDTVAAGAALAAGLRGPVYAGALARAEAIR